MANPNITQTLETKQELRLFLRIEQANLLEMSEEEFQRLIWEIEKAPLFKRLREQEKVIHYQRFSRSDLSRNFLGLKEEIIAAPSSFDVESLIANKEELLRLIKNLGLDKFKQYFLYPEPGITVEQIAHQCQLEISEVNKINNLIDEFSIASEFYHSSSISDIDKGKYYSKVASIERGPEGFIIAYFSPAYARGKFIIDYGMLEQLLEKGVFNKTEIKEIRQLIRNLELINSRKNTLHQVLQNIVEKQALFFESGNPKALLPFSQKELAAKLGLTPSTVSRAIASKSVETPWGERPIKDFFPNLKRFRKELIKQILKEEEKPLSDQAIKVNLEKKFGVFLSRRTIASLRKELKVPPSRYRKENIAKSV